MNRVPLTALLLVVTVLLAGCLGGITGDGTTTVPDAGDATPTRTTTESATQTTKIAPTQTTQTTTATSGDHENADLPPNVTERGVSNASAFLDAHVAALAETGFEFEYRVSNERGDRTVDGVQHGAGTAGMAAVLVETSATTDTTKTYSATWANDSTTLGKYIYDDNTRYHEIPRTDEEGPPGGLQVTKVSLLRSMLETGDFETVGTERVDGRALTTLRASEYAGDGYFQNVSSYEAIIVADSTGRVHEFHWSVESDETTLDHDFELTSLGPTTVERPDWASKAIQKPTVELGTTTDSGRLEITHEGGDVLQTESEVVIGHDGEKHTVAFEESFEVGDTAYLYYPADGGDPVLTTTDPGPDAGVQFDGSYSLTVVSADGYSVSSFGFAVGHESSSDSSSSSSSSGSSEE